MWHDILQWHIDVVGCHAISAWDALTKQLSNGPVIAKGERRVIGLHLQSW